MNLYGSDVFGWPREWLSEERDDDVFAPPRFWSVANRLFLRPDDDDDDDDDDPFNREHHREGEEKEATKTLILFSHTNTHTHTLSLFLFLSFPLKTLSRARRLYYAPRLRVCALLYIISDEMQKKDILPRKRERKKKETKKLDSLGFNTLNKKQSKNLFGTKMHRRATRRDRLV
jgi:hypothetical protein